MLRRVLGWYGQSPEHVETTTHQQTAVDGESQGVEHGTSHGETDGSAHGSTHDRSQGVADEGCGMSPKGRGMSPEDRRAFAAGFGVHLPAPKPWPTAHNVPHSGETIRLGRSPCRKPTADDVAKEFLAWASQQEQFWKLAAITRHPVRFPKAIL